MSKSIYIASDWLNPPEELSDYLEEHGYKVIGKWWENRSEHHHKLEQVVEKYIKKCDIFILSTESPRADTHAFAGSHVLAGIAYALGKQIAYLGKQKTGLLNEYLFTSKESMLVMLKPPAFEII